MRGQEQWNGEERAIVHRQTSEVIDGSDMWPIEEELGRMQKVSDEKHPHLII